VREYLPDLFVPAPFQPHSPTSKQAAREIAPKASTLREDVLRFVQAQGARGATDEEVQAALGMAGSTERPRRVELLEAGQVKASGVRRTSSGRRAVVWIATKEKP
jgi:hypothetical protein